MSHRDREVYPHVLEAVGEDPARFLDRDLGGGLPPLVEARISGIDELRVVGAWQGVEHRLLRSPDGAGVGRPTVKQRLHRRARELEASGGREAALEERREFVEPEESDDVDEIEDVTLWRHVAESCGSLDVEPNDDAIGSYECNGCGSRVPSNRVERVDADEVSIDELPDALERLGAVRREGAEA